ncbi:MAG: hypothetical protein V3W14_00560, partial [Candidatus Neomarinimicrobiota bacterium]
TILVIYIFISNVASIVTAQLGIHNLFLFTTYAVVAFPAVAVIYSYWMSKRYQQYLIYRIVPVHFSLNILILSLGQAYVEAPEAVSLAFTSLLLVVLSFYILLSLLRNPPPHPAYRDERFWVALGIFVYYTGNAFVYAGVLSGITIEIWRIHNLLNFGAFLCYIIGYLCIPRPRTSLS